jgi:hypothetical protein
MPNNRALAAVLMLGTLLCPSIAGAVNNPEFFAGNYRQVNPVTKRPLPVGSAIVLVRAKNGKLGFSINAIRALDSNQGFIAGTFQPASKVVWVQKADGANCKLTFTAIPNGMTVVEDEGFGDCGFGYGVTAAGTYRWMGEVGSKT